MSERISTACPKCGEDTLDLEVSAAAHDDMLLDLVITCSTEDGGCGVVLNSFQSINEMMEVR